MFDRIVCAVDASEESLEAARQAARLAGPSGRLVLVAVSEIDIAVQAGWAAPAVIDELRVDAERALAAAREAVGRAAEVETRLLEGPAPRLIHEEVAREQASLLAVGTHGHGRVAGVLLGSLTTSLLHDAHCAVLVARRPHEPEAFPRSLVVGFDGSPASERAYDVASGLASRFDAALRCVVASGGKAVDLHGVRAARPDAVVVEGKPVDALVRAAEAADLLVVGSRGLHGVRSLGSVGERAAHEARCSVLVVR